MAEPNSRKITKYPKNMNNINIGMVFFAVIAIYVFISVITYFKKDHIVGYQVISGSLSSNNIYEAVALRTEQIVTSDTAGNVNYFATEGGRVAVGNLVYTVDESQELITYLKSQGTENVNLSDKDLSELRTQIVNFNASFDPRNFYTVYDFQVGLDGTVQKLSNNSILADIQALNASSAVLQSINYKYAQDTGIVVYSTDGYEDKTLQSLTSDDFDQSKYEKKQLINNELVKAGDPVYKLCTREEWSIVIMENDPEKVNYLLEKEYVKVRFIKNQDESWGKVSSFTNDQGDTFIQLTFTNSMITFCRDRFLSVELMTEDESGLKIPNSSIVNKTFFLVPKEYVVKNNDNTTTVLRDKYDEQGNETTELVTVSVYNETETEYYLDNQTLRAGDILILPESTQRFTVSKTDSLIGVYNINKGYADFRQIKILYQNEEYAIVRSNTMYGLSVYDYIVLDSSTIDENGKVKTGSNLSVDKDEASEDGSDADTPEDATENASEESQSSVTEDSANSENTGDTGNSEEIIESEESSSLDNSTESGGE